jgi:transcriptional pleiotropic regulator of transition state genes
MGNNSGMVRRIDKLGRVVLPAEMKKELGLANEQKVEFHFEGDCIIIKKYKEHCVFCDSKEGLMEYKRTDGEGEDVASYICKKCLSEIMNLK